MELERIFSYLSEEIKAEVSIDEVKAYVYGHAPFPPLLQEYIDGKKHFYWYAIYIDELGKKGFTTEEEVDEEFKRQGMSREDFNALEKNALAYHFKLYQEKKSLN